MRLEYSELPPLALLRQEFPPTRVADVAKELRSQLDGSGVALKPSGRYAIAWRSCGSPPPDRFRVLRIMNTLRLKYLLATPAALEQLREPARCKALGTFREWFGKKGTLKPFPAAKGRE